MIDIITTCIMYRFYTYYKYIIIIVIFYLFSLINMNDGQNEYWNASPLRPKSGSNIAQLLLHMRFLFLPFTLS